MNRAIAFTLVIALTLAGCRGGSDHAVAIDASPTMGPMAGVDGPAGQGEDHAGMDMAGMDSHVSAAPPSPAVVSIDARGAVLANIKTARTSRRPLAPGVTAAGRVTYDEARLARVTAWVEGRIQHLYVATTGAPIRKGQPIADLYSPDLVATQQELLMARDSARTLAGSPIEGVAADAQRLVVASRRRLLLWGISEAQIAQIERRGRPRDTLPILAPASGIVIRRLVQVGDWVAKGTPLYEIADLSRVWIEADIYESELAGLRPGLPVTVMATAYPGETFRGRVAFVVPSIANETRTNTIRVELANPGGKLKPDMGVSATITLDRGTAIVVPTDAVVDTGTRQVVWVQRSAGRFEARDVVVGTQTDDGYEIRRGLREGELIAVSGGFMLDASSQLDRGGGAHSGHGASSPRAPGAATPGTGGRQP